MSLLWLLVITCFLCFFHDLHAESPGNEPIEFSEDTLFIMNSLFGFRPCLDEACGGLQPLDYNVDHTSKDSAGSESTSKYPPVTPPSPDPVVEYCLPLHSSAVQDISIIEKRHPDIKDIKSEVVESIIAYVVQFSVLNAEKCESAVKLLDFILLAVQAMRHSYVGDNGITCNYTEIIDGYPDQTEDASTPSKCDPPSVTPDYVSTEADYKPTTSGDDRNVTVSPVKPTVEPCPESSEETEEIVAEDGHDSPFPPFVGSVRGLPGVHYPNYTDVPVTSFSCADKKYIPGFYADLEAGCQVFHVCYEHRRESFLCPVGTIFNQPILACDYWYSSNCSLAPAYYEINAKAEEVTEEEEMNVAVGELITVLVESKHESMEDAHKPSPPQAEVDITKFLPVKAKVTEFTKPVPEMPGVSTVSPQSLEVDEVASQIFNKMVSSATVVASKSRGVIGKIPDPGVKGELAAVAGGLAIKPVIAKAKLSAAAAASVPAAKIAVAKVAVPIAVKTKLAAAVPLKAAIPVAAKAKAVAAASIPAAKIAAAKAAVPIAVKTKLAAAVPLKAAIPVAAKAKAVAAASIPAAKIAAAKAAVPIAVKTKLAAAVPLKAAIPVAAKAVAAASIPAAKIAAAKAAVPIAVKTSLAAAPKVAVKASIPVLKAKMVASAIPLAKSKIVAPALKGLKLKTVGAPFVKTKVAALPLVKSAVAAPIPIVKAKKLVAAAAISPLTKKALALGYMKLLKAKKLALVG